MEEVKIYGSRDDDGILQDDLGNVNVAETCRLCLKSCGAETRRWAIFETDLPQKLMAFATVQIQENDGLPTIICTNCRNLIYMSYDFKCQVEKSDHDLRQALLLRQSTTHWSTVPIVKSIENIHAVEAMVPCLQKNVINPYMAIKDEHNVDNHEQFIFEITNNCNMEESIAFKRDNQMQTNNSVETDNITENSNVLPFQQNNALIENKNSQETDAITFDTQYNTKNEVKNNFEKSKPDNIPENCNQSDDEKPLILRTKRHKCNYCIKSFANLSLLEKHAIIHKRQPEVIYVCYICNEEFSSVEKIKNHAITNHDINMDTKKIMENMKTQQVSDSIKKVGDYDNDKQIDVSSTVNNAEKKNTKFTCKFCPRQFTYHKPFIAHIKSHPDYDDKSLNIENKGPEISETDSSELTSVESNVCSENVEIACHSTQIEVNSQSTNVEDISHSRNIDTTLQIEHLKAASEENSFKDVCNKGSTDESEDCNDDENDDDDDDDDDDDRNKGDEDMPASIQCNQCGKLVATLRNLKRHLLTHSGLKHKCSICGKDFSRPDKLREHQQLKHKEEVFGKSDSDNESSDDHNVAVSRKKDKSNRPYKCSLCPKAFAQPQSLANHEERHKRVRDVQKRYLCEVCSKCFAQSGSLVAHMRTHTGVKPYVCNVCSRAFTKSTYLQLHLRTHSGERPYICQYCSRAFARANTLARHITMHTGEAKYQCQICTKSFRRLTSLNEHTYTHTGQRPYACKICSKRYNNAGSLYAHTKKCKAMQASTNSTTYPVSLHAVDNGVQPQNDNNSESQLVIITEKKLEETITDETVTSEPPTCQFMITNIHGQKPMSANILEPFTIQEPDVYNINSKQFKTPYYGLYPSM